MKAFFNIGNYRYIDIIRMDTYIFLTIFVVNDQIENIERNLIVRNGNVLGYYFYNMHILFRP